MSIGPVEYMVVAFPGNKFTGQIAPALAELVESNTIRIIDLAFVTKDADGSIAAFELSELDPDVAALFSPTGASTGGLFNDEDLAAAGEELEPNSSAALLVWEDVWATKLADAIREAGGELYDLDRIPHDVVVAAMEYAKSNAAG
jgi:uncharacterized membrane protein